MGNLSNMSDVSVDLSKMKVADLKKELKARGLSADGKKNELQERLAEALAADGSVLGGPAEDGDVDEEELLGDDEEGDVDATTEQELLGQAAKRPAPTPIDVISPDKKVCKLGKPAEEEKPVSDKPEEEKTAQEKRAERFGLPVSDQSKKSARAERFGIIEKPEKAGKPNSKRAPKLDMTTGSTDIEKLKARSERFGEVSSKTLKKVSELEKKKERADRFKNGEEAAPETNGKEETATEKTSDKTPITIGDSKAEEAKKKRAERFAAK